MRNLVLILAIITILGACTSTPRQPQIEDEPNQTPVNETWTGTSTSSFPGTLTLQLRIQRDDTGTVLNGNYLADVSPGKFYGRVNGTELTATLEASRHCTFSLTGTMTTTTLTANFEPDDCPGGSTGTWELERTE